MEVTQYVVALPSTLTSKGRAKCTEIRVPSVICSSRAGATSSRPVTSTPWSASTSPTVPPKALTSCDLPSRVTVTDLLRAV